MEEAISLEGLTKRFGRRRVLDHLDWRVKRGELVGLVGENGIGKTTLLRLMCRLLRPNEGTIEIFGLNLSRNYQKIFQETVVVFDTVSLCTYLSGFDNLRIFASIYRKVSDWEIRSALEIAGLGNRGRDKLNTYSLGMKQRVNVAKLLLIRPKLVMMDEPFNGIDREGVDNMIEVIRKLNREEGTTFLVSSHQSEEMNRFCGRVALLEEGKIARDLSLAQSGRCIVFLQVAEERNWPAVEARYRIIRKNGCSGYIEMEEKDVPGFSRFLLEEGIAFTGFNRINDIQALTLEGGEPR